MDKITRAEYLDHCGEEPGLHRAYYAQFVGPVARGLAKSIIGIEKLLASTDLNFNDIPLARWDSIALAVGSSSLMKEYGDVLTLSGQVCILKEAARQLVEEHKEGG